MAENAEKVEKLELEKRRQKKAHLQNAKEAQKIAKQNQKAGHRGFDSEDDDNGASEDSS